jgi:hypothetical protein
MQTPSDFLVYYGHDEAYLDALTQTDLLIFEARGWSPVALQKIAAGPGKRLAYLSPFAWSDWQGRPKWWWGKKERDPQWDAWWLSLASPGWRFQVHREWQTVLQGFDGIFFDNLDRLEQDPKSLKPFVDLLKTIKKARPDAILVGNRGFIHWPHFKSYLDGVLFENLTDQAFSDQDKRWVKSQLERLENTTVLALDYQTRRVDQEAQRLLHQFPNTVYYCAPNEGLQSLS